jgi:hypothetical protein
VTPTVSMLSPERWLLSLTLDSPDSLNLRRWLSALAMVDFSCGVARMWPEPICTRHRAEHDYIEARTSVMRTPRPSTVLKRLWSDVATSRTDLGLSAARRSVRARDRVSALPKVAKSETSA